MKLCPPFSDRKEKYKFDAIVGQNGFHLLLENTHDYDNKILTGSKIPCLVT